MVETGLWLAAIALLLITLPGTIELALVTIGVLLPARPRPATAPSASKVRLAVIIPVFNEERGLPRTIGSLLACDDPLPPGDLIVMACNCTDRTAEVARGLGCSVVERIDPARRGKGYGLDYAFRNLAASAYEAYVILDADTIVERNFLNEFRSLFANGAVAGQCILRVANPAANIRTRLMAIAFRAMTFLRPLARHRLGLSAGIFGNGFGVLASTVRRVPYECFSVAEDLEYHTELIRAGVRVEFLAGTAVSTEMCLTGAHAKPQRERWEGGRLRILMEQAPKLAADVVLRGRTALLEPLLDLLLLPLAYHVLLLALLALAAFFVSGPLFVFAVISLLLVVAHVAMAMVLGRAGKEDWKALAMVPFYIGWKLMNLGGILKAARKSTPWKRTARDPA